MAHGVAKSECSTKAFVKCKANREKQLKCTETNLRRKRDVEERLLYIQDHLEKFSKALRRRKVRLYCLHLKRFMEDYFYIYFVYIQYVSSKQKN